MSYALSILSPSPSHSVIKYSADLEQKRDEWKGKKKSRCVDFLWWCEKLKASDQGSVEWQQQNFSNFFHLQFYLRKFSLLTQFVILLLIMSLNFAGKNLIRWSRRIKLLGEVWGWSERKEFSKSHSILNGWIVILMKIWNNFARRFLE